MEIDFSNIPVRVRRHVRSVFARANDVVSTEMIEQPFTTEPALDTSLIKQVTARPATFFPAEQVLVRIATHSLASRRLYDGVEIADIAVVVTLSQHGQALKQKVGLIQTKRLFARHVRYGAPTFTAVGHMKFSYDENCHYEALQSGSAQSAAITAYAQVKLPVFYGLYNPLEVPYDGQIPAVYGDRLPPRNEIGFRVLPAVDVHKVLVQVPTGQSPTFGHLTSAKPYNSADPLSRHGWRLEHFVADELLPCRQGGLLDDKDPKLIDIIFARERPLFGVLEIGLDFGERPSD